MNDKPLTVRELINNLESLIKDNPGLDMENMLVAKEDYDGFAIGPSTWISELRPNDIRLIDKLEALDDEEYDYDVGYSTAMESEPYYIVIN